MSWEIRRRHLLTGAGAVLALPFLESLMAPRRARATTPADPRRFVSLYMPNGTYNIQGDAVWYPPAGPLAAGTLPITLQPFAANIADFSVLMHPACAARDQAASRAPDGGGHLGAVTTWLSQAALTDFNANMCTVPGSSFDQMYADASGKPLLVTSGGCNNAGSPDQSVFNYADYVSYNNGQPNEPHKNPVELFNAMFASIKPMPSAPPLAAQRNHSILDSSLADIADMQSKLGKTDNQKLDQYLTSVRNLENRLYSVAMQPTSGCMPGTAPGSELDNTDQDGSLSSVYNQRVQAFFDMFALGFQCDLFRSAVFAYDGEAADRPNNQCPPSLVYQGVSLTGVLHIGISHYGINQNGREKCISRDRNYLQLFCYLLNALKGIHDPSGAAILDNTIVMAGFNVTDGQHNGNAEGTPLVVGGGKNLGLHPGQCIDLAGADLVDLYYTFSTMLGMGITDFRGSTKVLSV